MQELLRHFSLRSTMDIYTQAVTPAKREAQTAVLSLLFSSERGARLSQRSERLPQSEPWQGEGAKRAQIRPFCTLERKVKPIQVAESIWRPRQDLNPR